MLYADADMPVPLGCGGGLPAPCRIPQHLIHLVPGENLSKLKIFATLKVTCSVSP